MLSRKPFPKSLGVLLMAALAVACVDHAYDFDKLDRNITLASEGISFPLGSTKQLTVASLIGDNLGDLLTLGPDGTYSINYDTQTIGVDLKSLENIDASLSFGLDETEPVNVNVHIFDKPEVTFTGEYGEEVDISDKIKTSGEMSRLQKLDITINDLPDELDRIEAMTLRAGATLKLSVKIPDCLLSRGTITSGISIDFSQLLELQG